MITYVTKDGIELKFYEKECYVEGVRARRVMHEIHIPGIMHEVYAGGGIKALKIVRDNTEPRLTLKEGMDGLRGRKDITIKEVRTVTLVEGV